MGSALTNVQLMFYVTLVIMEAAQDHATRHARMANMVTRPRAQGWRGRAMQSEADQRGTDTPLFVDRWMITPSA